MIQVVVTLMVVGVLLWLLTTYVPMQPVIKQIIVAVVVICVVLWLLQIFGVLSLVNAPVPRLRH
jgi:hypothetical protein